MACERRCNGLRTAMAVSRSANPARLVLPPIMDPLYGYEAVNVEAQAGRCPFVAQLDTAYAGPAQQAYCISGAVPYGSCRPATGRSLLILREYQGETILCVANLSRLPQAVELDLANFAGYIPIELTGMSPFPPIGQLTYLARLCPLMVSSGSSSARRLMAPHGAPSLPSRCRTW